MFEARQSATSEKAYGSFATGTGVLVAFRANARRDAFCLVLGGG
jgi:hypothetical protein